RGQQPAPGGAPAQRGPAAVQHGTPHVGQRAVPVGQPVPVPVQAAEGVLYRVLGAGPVAQHEVGQPDQPHGVVLVQRRHGRRRTVRGRFPARLRPARIGPGQRGCSARLFRLHVIQTPGALYCCFRATGIRGLVSCGAARARNWLWLWQMHSKSKTGHDFVVVASRLPVDRVEDADGSTTWRTSPGGLGLSDTEVRHFYEGFCNATLWPLYHDVIAPPQFHRRWWEAYVTVNRRFAEAAAEQAAPGATVWVHDYQLQLVPRMLRQQRGDVRIGFFNHIPFPGYEIFAQLPWRRQVVEGLLGADLLGFQRRADATNFLRASRRAVGLNTKGSTVRVAEPGGSREIHAAAFP